MIATGRAREHVHKAAGEDAPDPHWEYVYRLDREFQAQWEATFDKGFGAWRAGAKVSELQVALEVGDPSLLRETVEVQKEVREVLRGWQAPIEAVFGRAARAELARMGMHLNFRLDNPYALRWIEQHTGDLITVVTEESRKAIQNIVLEGFRQHLPPRRFAIQIREWIGLTDRQMKAATNYWVRMNEVATRRPRTANEMADTYAHRLLRQRALTIARTETVAAAAGGTQASFIAARDAGLLAPETRREWIAAASSRRTCPICMGLHGKTAGLDEGFQSSYNGEWYFLPPGHSACRCSVGLVTAVPAEKPAPAVAAKPARIPAKVPAKPKEEQTAADRVRARIDQGAKTWEDLRDIGRLVEEATETQEMALAQTIEQLRGQYKTLSVQANQAGDSGQVRQESAALKRMSDLLAKRIKLQQELGKGRGELRLKVLQQVRPMGGKGKSAAAQKWTEGTSPITKAAFNRVSRYMPDAWLEQSAREPLKGIIADRGYYDHADRTLALGRSASRRDATTLHEMGHRMEDLRPTDIDGPMRAFLEYRTKGEREKWLGAGYGPTEKAKVDRFLNPYIGKQYKTGSEVLSMGLPNVFGLEPNGFDPSGDPEYLHVILGALAAL